MAMRNAQTASLVWRLLFFQLILCCALGLMCCTRYQSERVHSTGEREIAGKTVLSPPVTEFKLDPPLQTKGGFYIFRLYLPETEDKDKDSYKFTYSGEIVTEDGKTIKLRTEGPVYSIADLKLESEATNYTNVNISIIRLHVSQQITIDHFVAYPY